jgi:hypothetical protein
VLMYRSVGKENETLEEDICSRKESDVHVLAQQQRPDMDHSRLSAGNLSRATACQAAAGLRPPDHLHPHMDSGRAISAGLLGRLCPVSLQKGASENV